jgi:sigma-B regulation protein RsbQ
MLSLMEINVVVRRSGDEMIVFANGFGSDFNMWRFVAPVFEDPYRIVLFNKVGTGPWRPPMSAA